MKVRCNEGVAIHVGPESCAAHREVWREALTGVRTGQPLSRDRKYPGCRRRLYVGRQHAHARHRECMSDPAWSLDPGMCARSLYGNREISGLTSRSTGLARVGKARSRSR